MGVRVSKSGLRCCKGFRTFIFTYLFCITLLCDIIYKNAKNHVIKLYIIIIINHS